MSTRKARIPALLLAIPLAAASFCVSAADAYSVSLHLFHKGKEFGAPSMVVKSGVQGSMEVSGPDGYKLKLTATDDGPNRIKVSTQLDSAHGAVSPEVIVRPGKPRSLSEISKSRLQLARMAANNSFKPNPLRVDLIQALGRLGKPA